MNLAFALAMRQDPAHGRLRVGLLDLDIFGPSLPKLMGLESAPEPPLTDGTPARLTGVLQSFADR